MKKVLIIEDDHALAAAVSDALTKQGYTIESVEEAREGLSRLNFYQYDAAIVDWELPDFSGPELIREYRSNGGLTPVLMLTGKGLVNDKLAGFNAGADDYLTKPFDIRELGARLEALLKRPRQIKEAVIQSGALQLNASSGRVFREGVELDVRPQELSLLEFFMRNPARFFTIEALIERVWKSDESASDEGVRASIKRLRKAIDKEGHQSMISTVRGLGYRFDPPPG